MMLAEPTCGRASPVGLPCRAVFYTTDSQGAWEVRSLKHVSDSTSALSYRVFHAGLVLHPSVNLIPSYADEYSARTVSNRSDQVGISCDDAINSCTTTANA